jgi:hypothetical protein
MTGLRVRPLFPLEASECGISGAYLLFCDWCDIVF